MERRSFLELALLALPAPTLLAQATSTGSAIKPQLVRAGEDREQKKRTVGVSSTTYKVLTAETNGAMFALEQSNVKKGGPSLHLHHDQDELFFVLEGEYVVEVGGEQFHLHAGDCVLGPRGVPHAWAFVGETTGRMLLTYTPAGRMEAFFNDRERLGIKPGEYAGPDAKAIMHDYGMELLGPPLKFS